MGEAHGAPGFRDAGGDECGQRSLQLVAGEAGQPCGIADPRTVAECAERTGEHGGLGREPRDAQQHGVGDAARDDGAHFGRGSSGGIEAPRSRLAQELAEQERVAAVTSRHASTNRSSGSSASRSATTAPIAAGESGDGRNSSVVGSPTSVAASGVSAGSSGRVARIRPSGCRAATHSPDRSRTTRPAAPAARS